MDTFLSGVFREFNASWRYKPLFLIDISLPRVLIQINQMIMFSFGIEDLREVVDKNKQERELR